MARPHAHDDEYDNDDDNDEPCWRKELLGSRNSSAFDDAGRLPRGNYLNLCIERK